MVASDLPFLKNKTQPIQSTSQNSSIVIAISRPWKEAVKAFLEQTCQVSHIWRVTLASDQNLQHTRQHRHFLAHSNDSPALKQILVRFSVKITRPSFPAKSCVVWLSRTLFVCLCTCLMMAWTAPCLSTRKLVWRHCKVAIHWGQLYIARFLPFCCLIYLLFKCLLIFATPWINLRSEK